MLQTDCQDVRLLHLLKCFTLIREERKDRFVVANKCWQENKTRYPNNYVSNDNLLFKLLTCFCLTLNCVRLVLASPRISCSLVPGFETGARQEIWSCCGQNRFYSLVVFLLLTSESLDQSIVYPKN